MAMHSSWRRKWQPTPVFLSGDYSPWGCRALDITKQLNHPFQYYSLENSMDYIFTGSQKVRHDWTTLTFSFSLMAQRVEKSACHAEDLGSIPGLGRSAGRGNGNPLHIADRIIPWTEEPGIVHGDAKEPGMTEYTYTFFFEFFSCLDYYRIFSRVPCAIQ